MDWDPFKFNDRDRAERHPDEQLRTPDGLRVCAPRSHRDGRFSQRPPDKELWTLADYYVSNDNTGEDGSGSGMDNWRYTWYSPDDYLLTLCERYAVGGRDRRWHGLCGISARRITLPATLDNQKVGATRASLSFTGAASIWSRTICLTTTRLAARRSAETDNWDWLARGVFRIGVDRRFSAAFAATGQTLEPLRSLRNDRSGSSLIVWDHPAASLKSLLRNSVTGKNTAGSWERG